MTADDWGEHSASGFESEEPIDLTSGMSKQASNAHSLLSNVLASCYSRIHDDSRLSNLPAIYWALLLLTHPHSPLQGMIAEHTNGVSLHVAKDTTNVA